MFPFLQVLMMWDLTSLMVVDNLSFIYLLTVVVRAGALTQILRAVCLRYIQ